jgi:hypothetical protein
VDGRSQFQKTNPSPPACQQDPPMAYANFSVDRGPMTAPQAPRAKAPVATEKHVDWKLGPP